MSIVPAGSSPTAPQTLGASTQHAIEVDRFEISLGRPRRDLLPILNSGRCELLDLPRLVAQLIGLERRTARSGKDSIDHGPGGHDDVANAAAGALMLALAYQPLVIPPGLLARLRAEGPRHLRRERERLRRFW